MNIHCGRCPRASGVAAVLALLLSAIALRAAPAQAISARRVGTDSVVVIAGERYSAGGLHRSLLGSNYRDLWTAPIKVPVLDLGSFAGGLRAVKLGGGQQAKSLRLAAADNSEWVFRPILKTMLALPKEYEHTIIWSIFRDQGSASHPTGAIAAAPMVGTAGILHATPTIVVMPDDPRLGEFRKDFAGVLGTIEEYPSTPKDGPAFARADKIIDSDELLDKINGDPRDRVDERAFLTARLTDMLLGDNDRHPDQWKWARLEKKNDALWEPIPRDRDKAFVSYQGLLARLARFALPPLVTFSSSYPDPTALFANAGEFDRRLLGSLDRSVWDSVATSLTRSITDDLIDRAVRGMPSEFAGSSQQIARTLKARRDRLPAAATLYYRQLWMAAADIHGTDADDDAFVVRSGEGVVDVSIRSGGSAPYFQRRFDARETKEIRIYLHGGNDRATVQGNARRSIPVRIIGGNGRNTFVDLSTVGGKRNPTTFYDVGTVQDVKYARDTIDEKRNIDNAFNHSFNRRPWVSAHGSLRPPLQDRGSAIRPVMGLRSQRGLGLVPRVGVARYAYGFRTVPYSSMMQGDVAYSTASNRFEIRGAMDKRFEGSDVHVPATASMSQLGLIQFHGFGNDVPDLRGDLYDVRQRQWRFHPAVGLSLNPVSEISLGPVVGYTVTDSVVNRFISQQRPYGFGNFGQAGLQLKLHYDSRYVPDTLKPRAVLEITGSGYPGLWSTTTAYESLDGFAAAFLTLPVVKKPVLAFRVGGKKLFGNFPFFDAAFLGGSSSLRTEERQRFAGDASLYGSAELRVPVARFPLILPLDVGLLGFTDAGRVYLNGQSPGGWHTAAGAGFWVGFLNPGTSVNVLFTNRQNRRIVTNIGFAF